jgi:DNA primase
MSNIYEIINLYVPLKPHVLLWESNCPFCKDKEKSLRVDREKETWLCTKCGKAGNAEQFKELYENRSIKTPKGKS